MVFSSLSFLFGYLPIVLIIIKAVPKHWRNAVLFSVSLIFYGWGEPTYIGIMLLSTLVDYFNGWMVHKNIHNKKVAFRFVIASIIFNVGLLSFFKYYDFFVVNLTSLGISGLFPLGLTLPLGISFYTFQTMSYPIDVYRQEAPVQKNILSFGAYVSMFPQLIAGPIVRYKDIANQLQSRQETIRKFYDGVLRFLIGLSKKVLLANAIGLVWQDIQQLSISQQSALTAWLGITAFGFQIYFDFSGYSDMAIGLGKMLGFDLPENFDYPYTAKSITEFWRRWHITLGQWFKNYVYIPLGGSRNGNVGLNLFAVWFLTGMWHGASWNFIFWGLYFWLLLIIEKKGGLTFLKKLPNAIQHGYTIFFVFLGWVLFYFVNIQEGINYFKLLFLVDTSQLFNEISWFYIRNTAVLWVVLILASTPHFKEWLKRELFDRYPILIPIAVFVALVLCVASLVFSSYNPFLYFRF